MVWVQVESEVGVRTYRVGLGVWGEGVDVVVPWWWGWGSALVRDGRSGLWEAQYM